MLRRRPFGTEDDLIRIARGEWFNLAPEDWLEAFADHPRIGDRDALARRFPETHHLAAGEQSGVAGSSSDVLNALAEGNAAYESRFGHIFIVCATGLDAPTMLRTLKERLGNDPSTELRIAAEEQAKITAIRLSKTEVL